MAEFELLNSLGIMLLAALGVTLAARAVRVPTSSRTSGQGCC
ncbi:hypothetical protein [Salinibacter altiplanensis]|nr:hypothetical protein [Salinibacter altiplanensis]